MAQRELKDYEVDFWFAAIVTLVVLAVIAVGAFLTLLIMGIWLAAADTVAHGLNPASALLYLALAAGAIWVTYAAWRRWDYHHSRAVRLGPTFRNTRDDHVVQVYLGKEDA